MAVNAHALTTRDRLIDFLELSNLSATDNTVLDMIIDSATDFIEHYCQRRFLETAYTNELYDGTNTDELLLKQYPINSSETFTLQERTTGLNDSNWSTVNSSYYFIDYEDGIIKLPKGSSWRYEAISDGSKFNRLVQGWRVTYTAGFDFDNAATFPSDVGLADLEYAVWRLGALIWNRRRGDPGVSSESIGDYSVSYTKAVMETEEIKSILDKYARFDLA